MFVAELTDGIAHSYRNRMKDPILTLCKPGELRRRIGNFIDMKTALVIFNGIQFPFTLAEQAIAWAKTNDAGIEALFLVGEEPGEGYGFPSDLNAAENLTDKEDAEKDNLRIVRSQVKLLEDMAKTDNVSCRAELLIDPELGEVMVRAKNAELLFIDAEYTNTGLLSVTSFDLEDLVDQSPCPVEKVPGKKS